MRFVYQYILSLWDTWFALAAALLTVIEIASKLFKWSWKWPSRRRLRLAAVVLLIVAQADVYRSLLDESARKIEEAESKARPTTSPVVAENPDHAEQLKELRRLQGIEQQFKDAERELVDKQSEIDRLRGQLDESQRRKELVARLTAYIGDLNAVRQKCRSLEPAAFLSETNKAFNGAINYLREQGRENDVQRLRTLAAPPGMPRLVAPNCEPYSSNSNVAFKAIVATYILNDVIDRVGD